MAPDVHVDLRRHRRVVRRLAARNRPLPDRRIRTTGRAWRLADGAIIGPETPASVRRRLRVVPADYGIAVACLDTSCQVVQPTPESRARVIDDGRRMLEIAAEIGAPFIRVFGGALPGGDLNTSISKATTIVSKAVQFSNTKGGSTDHVFMSRN